jgi:hypothetical protein
MLHWRTYYRELLIKNTVTVPLFILVLCVHYFCCIGTCSNILATDSTNMHRIHTPLHTIYSKYFAVDINISSTEPTPAPVEDIPATREWGSLATIVRVDPFSFNYTSVGGGVDTDEPVADPVDDSHKSNDTTQPPPTVKDTADINLPAQPIFDMFGIAILSFMIMWIPSIYTPFVCKASDVWLMGNCVLLLYFISWCSCIFTYAICHMHRVAYCMAMHMCVQHQYMLSVLVFNASDIPIPFPKILGSILGFGAAIILFYISHACGTHLSFFNSLDFYMSHTWAFILIELLRIIPYRMVTGTMLVETKSHNA